MAKSRLTPDYIEWVMSLNANQALRDMHNEFWNTSACPNS